MFDKIKEWLKIILAWVVALFTIGMIIDYKRSKKNGRTIESLEDIKELDKRKVDKDAFKNNSSTDNLNIIRRIIKRRRDK